VLAEFASGGDHGSLCEAARRLLAVTATCVTLTSDLNRGRLCGAGDVAAELDELQFTTGQGPTIDACNGTRPVLEAAVAHAGARWAAFAAAAVAAGVGAVFAYPLRLGAARLGALTLYQLAPGPLTDEQRACVAIVADVLPLHIIAMQATARGSGELAEGLRDAAMHRAEVHQAGGMISAQLEVGIVEALIRLRSHAYASGRPVAEVAADVIARRLRFD
jgi:ANTAR domain